MLQYLVKRLLGLHPDAAARRGAGVPVRAPAARRSGAAGRGPDATPETVALVRQDLGLDKSLPRAVRALRRAASLHGDFGRSLRTKRPVSTEIAERFMPTFWLTVAAHGVVGRDRHG